MNQRHVKDWRTLEGASVEIRYQGSTVSSGFVDAVTDDGSILWIHSTVDGRQLFEKASFYQVWACEERTGFHYQVSMSEQPERDLLPAS
ncbi:hypothetical protein [Arthrobacter sp. SLBN-122]|uniref:hypothetical protein n=1 Tax=Arthrobacter sp. SLBN-122 TaxID=2768455 RepID=UPI0011540BA3|nr:hypothetical protein [Arthrobacter sp. SLBN-122]TQJ34196.1 hypothetical protein FBY36_1427 [Arthrobacter sp. SLBN-122]